MEQFRGTVPSYGIGKLWRQVLQEAGEAEDWEDRETVMRKEKSLLS